MTDYVEAIPAMQSVTTEFGPASRIRDLDKEIQANPENFMNACRALGGVALEYMDETPSMEVPASEENVALVRKLSMFLQEGDLKHVDFDPRSDDAIYGHPGVIALNKAVRNEKPQFVRQGSKHIPRENHRATQLVSGASVLKLYLYADRVKQARSLIATKDVANGAA